MSEESDKEARKALSISLDAIESIEGRVSDSRKAHLIANNVLKEEMGVFGPYDKHYFFDETTRDVLLAHGREDASAARVGADYAMKYAKDARRYAKLAFFCSAIGMAGTGLLILSLVVFR